MRKVNVVAAFMICMFISTAGQALRQLQVKQ